MSDQGATATTEGGEHCECPMNSSITGRHHYRWCSKHGCHTAGTRPCCGDGADEPAHEEEGYPPEERRQQVDPEAWDRTMRERGLLPEPPPPPPEPLYLLVLVPSERGGRGAYWKANRSGYTSDLLEAGMYPEAEARRLAGSGHTTIAVLAAPVFEAAQREARHRAESLESRARTSGYPLPGALGGGR